MIFSRISKRNLITLAVLLFLFLLAYTFIEPYLIEVKHIYIKDPDIPSSFNNLKAAFISDIHHGPFFSVRRVKELVAKANKIKPDIILLGGDYVFSSSRYIEPCFKELKFLNAPLGKFGVLGNHDHWENPVLTRQSMQKAGIVVLNNSASWVYKGNERIKIGGVGELWTDIQDIYPTVKGVSEEDFVVLLSHNPEYVESLKEYNVDIVLSGHTHGGQVTFFGLWAPLFFSNYGQKYRSGVVDTEYTKVIISNGVGTTIFPARFFARPQIVLLHFVKNCTD